MSAIVALVFARYPNPGSVKTRMVPPLSAAQAAELHRASLAATWDLVKECSELDARLVVTPDDCIAELRRLMGASINEGWPQGGGNLGSRLVRATDRAFAEGADGVILLGADSPTLPPIVLRDAAARLKEHAAILGPCLDGGYYLLGLGRPCPSLFEDIEWGGPAVAEQTRQRAVAAGIDLLELSPWYDLDRFDDLVPAATDLARMTPPLGPSMIRLRRLIDALIERERHGRFHAAKPRRLP